MATKSKSKVKKTSKKKKKSSVTKPYYDAATHSIVISEGFGGLELGEDDDKDTMLRYFRKIKRVTKQNIARYGNGNGSCPVGVIRGCLLPDSTHRDGSIFKDINCWQEEYCIANQNETYWEAMALSDPKDCKPDRETCLVHSPCDMLQIFSLKLAEVSVDGGTVKLYGYVAVRDLMDPLRNYIFNRSSEDPIIVKQGSLTEITGPKWGINMSWDFVIEFDLKMKKGGQEENDQLIYGAIILDARLEPYEVSIRRIYGDCGAVDITLALINYAVKATVEVVLSEVQSSFNLSLSSFVSGIQEEIQLFQGAIGEQCGLRSVLAVGLNTWVQLKFKAVKVGSGSSTELCCSFKPKKSWICRARYKARLCLYVGEGDKVGFAVEATCDQIMIG